MVLGSAPTKAGPPSRLGRRGSVIGAQGIAPTCRAVPATRSPARGGGNKGGTARGPDPSPLKGEGFVLGVRNVPMLGERPFYEFVREERLFCATLAHLLMERGPNLATFLRLVNAKLPGDSQVPTTGLEEAQIYVEFTFLRDYWNRLGRDNNAKRSFIFKLLSRVEGLRCYQDGGFPDSISGFNEFFVGPPGGRIEHDIVYPGRWSVTSLYHRFGRDAAEFRDFCRFKWAFNIKPDMVVLLPSSSPLCIEAKLESGEGFYPTSRGDCEIFDRLFGPEQGKVHQFELQQFMFRVLLDDPCHSVVVARTVQGGSEIPFLSWEEVFGKLDLSSSIGYVRRLVEENRHLKALLADSGS